MLELEDEDEDDDELLDEDDELELLAACRTLEKNCVTPDGAIIFFGAESSVGALVLRFEQAEVWAVVWAVVEFGAFSGLFRGFLGMFPRLSRFSLPL